MAPWINPSKIRDAIRAVPLPQLELVWHVTQARSIIRGGKHPSSPP
eukprot:CAMPEP_0204136148 /NCGR_PEP_ID=MMETSP0361-20130328/16667_1 /ASSEMBLY_ACC=CAM_ASM_000343 /TAXON_ID=268821 /ORGANISM="Scrippsiella Hangoei, Strain SHTV-5" /LENGTH=45 /DNA_ID= /DNA_START= /DNA_END= /DNA_ORIENTATION=